MLKENGSLEQILCLVTLSDSTIKQTQTVSISDGLHKLSTFD